MSDKEKKRDFMAEALEIFSGYHFKTPDDIEALYVFFGGVYMPAEPFVKGLLEANFGIHANTGFCYEVIGHLKRQSYCSRKEFNKFEDEIPVQNGILNITTGQLSQFDPEKIFTYKLQAKFDSTKTCPKFLKFMEDVQPDVEDRLTLQEYGGTH